nr:holo-ACP synthase [Tissierella sp.]
MRTGVDIVEVARIARIISKNRESFYRKIFTKAEQEYIEEKNHNSKTIAGLFASKEAVSKLIGTGIGKLSWKDIEVMHDGNGRPKIKIEGKIESFLKELDLNFIEISISHEREYAICFAIGY